MIGRRPTVPNTVTDQQMADLSRRAHKANPSMFTDQAIKQRKNSQAQQRKAEQS